MCLRSICAAFPTLALAATAFAGIGDLEVIFTEVDGHPTSVVPGALDAAGMPVVTEFKALELLSVSPDGSRWVVKARNELGSDLETILLTGSGVTGSMFAQEGQPVLGGAGGEVYDFFGSGRAWFNDLNQFVFTARARGGDPTTAQKGQLFDGVSTSVVLQQGDPLSGLLDNPPNPSGDELYGNSVGSMHLLNDGTIGTHDTTIQNIFSLRRPAVFYDDTSFIQRGVTPLGGALWEGLDSNKFVTTPNGEHWYVQGDDDGPTTSDDVLVVDGAVVIREGSLIGLSGVTAAAVFHTNLAPEGTWFARGDDPADDDWAARNSVILAATGQAITTGATEAWADAFLAFDGNDDGDWVLAGTTDGADTATDSVIVLNGEVVVVREGDPVDLDGNGMFDDDAFIGRGNETSSAFQPDDLFLAGDGYLYFFCALRDAKGNDLGEFGTGGDAFLRVRVLGAPCVADLDGSGDVGFADLLAVLSNWGPCPGCPEDLDGDDEVGFGDLLLVLSTWGACP